MQQVSPDPGVFFDCPEYTRLTQLIRHLAENTADVVLLVGDKGAGKTTFLYRIASGAPPHWEICRVDANPMMRPDQLFAGLARGMSAPMDTEDSAAVLVAAFAAKRLQGHLPVVVVDDAGQLPMGTLMALVRLHESTGDSKPPFALILMAEPAIEQTLATQQFHAMGTARFKRLDLPKLDYTQTGDYIRHFLAMEGVKQDLNLSNAQLERIHKDSAGLPGRVNELVIQVLHDPDQRKGLPGATVALGRFSRIPPMTSIAISGLLALLIASLVFQEEINRLFEGTAQPVVPSHWPKPVYEPASERLVAALPLPEPQAVTGAIKESIADRAVADPQSDQARLASEVGEGGLTADLQSGVEPLYMEPAIEPKPEVEPISALEQEPVPRVQALPTPVPDRLVVDNKGPSTVSQVTVELESRPEPTSTPKPKPKPKSKSKPKTDPKPKQKPAAKSRQTARGTRNKDWLAAQRPAAYTLQILGVSDERAAKRFIRNGRFSANVVYYESRRNGRPWFSVLHGVYSDRAAAMAALDRLPDSLRKIGAWPRSLRSVQAEMDRH